MTKRMVRNLEAFLLLLTLIVLSTSYSLQYFKGLQPCPLCLMQRVCTYLLGFTCLMGLGVSSLKRAQLIMLLQGFFATWGGYFSARQLWLQIFPGNESHACLPALNVLIHYFPWKDIAKVFFWGGASDCAEVQWQWLGLSLPAWSALYFITFIISSVVLFISIRKSLKRL